MAATPSTPTSAVRAAPRQFNYDKLKLSLSSADAGGQETYRPLPSQLAAHQLRLGGQQQQQQQSPAVAAGGSQPVPSPSLSTRSSRTSSPAPAAGVQAPPQPPPHNQTTTTTCSPDSVASTSSPPRFTAAELELMRRGTPVAGNMYADDGDDATAAGAAATPGSGTTHRSASPNLSVQLMSTAPQANSRAVRDFLQRRAQRLRQEEEEKQQQQQLPSLSISRNAPSRVPGIAEGAADVTDEDILAAQQLAEDRRALSFISPNVNAVRDWESVQSLRPKKVDPRKQVAFEQRVRDSMTIGGGKPEDSSLNDLQLYETQPEAKQLYDSIYCGTTQVQSEQRKQQAALLKEEFGQQRFSSWAEHQQQQQHVDPSVATLSRAHDDFEVRRQMAFVEHVEGRSTTGSGGVDGQPVVQDRQVFLQDYQAFLQKRREEYFRREKKDVKINQVVSARPYSDDFMQRLLMNRLEPPEPTLAEQLKANFPTVVSSEKRSVILPPNAPSMVQVRTDRSLAKDSSVAKRSASGGVVKKDLYAAADPSSTSVLGFDPESNSDSVEHEVAKAWMVRPKIVPPTGWTGQWGKCEGHAFLLHHMYGAGITQENSPSLVDWAMSPTLLSCIQRLSYGTNMVDFTPKKPTNCYMLVKLVVSTTKKQKDGMERRWVPSLSWSKDRHSKEDDFVLSLLEIIGCVKSQHFEVFQSAVVKRSERHRVSMLKGPKVPGSVRSSEVAANGCLSVYLTSGNILHFVATDPIVHNMWFHFFDLIGELNGSMELTGEIKFRRREIEHLEAEAERTADALLANSLHTNHISSSLAFH